MYHPIRVALFALLASVFPASGQEVEFGGKYEGLDARQKELVRRWAEEAGKISKRSVDPSAIYDKLPLSARTTFEAVTHALSRSQLTSGSGRPYGTALDLVDLVERVAGVVPGERGDQQFRIYVYLKADAVEKLYNSKEFRRGHDNTVFHAGYPINFRQLGGVPSIQISVTRTGRRADIDVDYRPSGGIQALTSGHLTAANSDVRAGNNYDRHVRRWEGFGNWWRNLMAALLSGPLTAELADFTPESHEELDSKSRGPLPEMISYYLEQWLLRKEPLGLLEAVSIKAYPCVAEFADGSHPDSRLALTRILNQLTEVSRRIGSPGGLQQVVAPFDYPLPGAEPVKHDQAHLFSVQRVHEDVAWAIDCRIRYGLHLKESIPRPEHKLDDTYVVSYKLNQKSQTSHLVQTWRKEAGEWKLVSFDIKRKHLTPDPNLMTRVSAPPGAKRADAKLESTVETFLSQWLLERKYDALQDLFLPESHACGSWLETEQSKPEAGGREAIRQFLSEVGKQAGGGDSLGRVVTAAQARHHGLQPLAHGNSGAYLLAEASGELIRNNPCAALAGTAPEAKPKSAPAAGVLLAMHFSHSRQASAGVISFYWQKVAGEWKISSYAVSAD